MNQDKSNSLIEELSLQMALADLSDLSSLGNLLNTLEKLSEEAGDNTSLLDTVRSLEALIRDIIMEEVEDREESFKTVSTLIESLHKLNENGDPSGGTDGNPPGDKSNEMPKPTDSAGDSGKLLDDLSRIVPVDISKMNDLSLVSEFVQETVEQLSDVEGYLLTIESAFTNDSDSDSDMKVAEEAIFRLFHTIKGAAGFLSIGAISVLAHATENILSEIRSGSQKLEEGNIDLIFRSVDAMKTEVLSLSESIKSTQSYVPNSELASLVEEILRYSPENRETKKRTPAEKPVPLQKKAGKPETFRTFEISQETIKVQTKRLDKLLDAIGELTIVESMVSRDDEITQGASQRVLRNLRQLSKIAKGLQEIGMSIRMMSLKATFQKMSRVVRDLSQRSGKKIRLEYEGENTEVDKSVIENIGDPLMHMVRNSVDHGIESPEERLGAGKPEAGVIHLRAFQMGGNICIEIEDDGRGLNLNRIHEKAIHAGLIQAGDKLSDHEIAQLIFSPGLSTAREITEISGRGVGMDVVKKNIENLQGRVDVSTVSGKGSRFTLQLPLTLAIVDGMIVKVGEERYIIPTRSMVESVRPKENEIIHVAGGGEICRVREKHLPLLRLAEVFQIPGAPVNMEDSLVIVVEGTDQMAGLVVNELVGQQQIVIKSLGNGVDNIEGVSGGAILSDGNISLILDVPSLIQLAMNKDKQKEGELLALTAE